MPKTAVKQPEDHYAPSAWGAAAESRKGFDFTVPSGQLCRIVPIPLEKLVLDGVIDDIDSVMRVVNSDIAKKLSPSGKELTEAEKDQIDAVEGINFIRSDAGKAAVAMMNKIVPLVVVKPTISPDPANLDDREDGKIYVSDISLVDRSAIFGVVMAPTEAAAQFRA